MGDALSGHLGKQVLLISESWLHAIFMGNFEEEVDVYPA